MMSLLFKSHSYWTRGIGIAIATAVFLALFCNGRTLPGSSDCIQGSSVLQVTRI
jgi:hypothetical protein